MLLSDLNIAQKIQLELKVLFFLTESFNHFILKQIWNIYIALHQKGKQVQF